MQVTLNSTVNHDGTTHQAGDTLELDDAAAKQLIDAGVAEKGKTSKPADTTQVEAPAKVTAVEQPVTPKN